MKIGYLLFLNCLVLMLFASGTVNGQEKPLDVTSSLKVEKKSKPEIDLNCELHRSKLDAVFSTIINDPELAIFFIFKLGGKENVRGLYKKRRNQIERYFKGIKGIEERTLIFALGDTSQTKGVLEVYYHNKLIFSFLYTANKQLDLSSCIGI